MSSGEKRSESYLRKRQKAVASIYDRFLSHHIPKHDKALLPLPTAPIKDTRVRLNGSLNTLGPFHECVQAPAKIEQEPWL